MSCWISWESRKPSLSIWPIWPATCDPAWWQLAMAPLISWRISLGNSVLLPHSDLLGPEKFWQTWPQWMEKKPVLESRFLHFLVVSSERDNDSIKTRRCFEGLWLRLHALLPLAIIGDSKPRPRSAHLIRGQNHQYLCLCRELVDLDK